MSNKPNASLKRKMAFVSIFIGVIFILMGVGIIPFERQPNEAPKFVLAVCGGIFGMAGLMSLMENHTKYLNLMASILIAMMGSVGAYVALYGESGNMSGGIGILSNSANITLGRVMFGFGAIICFAISVHALRKHFKNLKE